MVLSVSMPQANKRILSSILFVLTAFLAWSYFGEKNDKPSANAPHPSPKQVRPAPIPPVQKKEKEIPATVPLETKPKEKPGAMHDEGWVGLQDYNEAYKWHLKVAEKGDADAQFILAQMYETGRGVPKDDIEAYKWFFLSAKNGSKEAITSRNALEKRLSAQQMDEAKQRAEAPRKTNPPKKKAP
jgi:TPR repeat protein